MLSSSGITKKIADFSLQNFSISTVVSKHNICSISESINAFNNEATNLGLNVTWINNAPVFGAPNVGIFVSSFFITYTNPILGNYEVGVVSNMAGNIGMAARTTNIVKAVINYQQIGANQINAWIGQLFPVMVAVPAINNGVININNFQGTAWAFSDFT